MKNPEYMTYPTQNWPFTAAAAQVAGDFIQVGKLYGRVVDDVASGSVGMIAVRGIFEVAKKTTADTWSTGAELEAVVDGTTKAITLQARDQGVCIGVAYGASIGTDTTAKVELRPELN